MSRRRELTELAGGLLGLVVVFVLVRLLVSQVVVRAFFAIPTTANPGGGAVWSNLVASVVCLAVVWWRIRVRMIAHHVQAMAQAAQHHRDHLAAQATQHQALKDHLSNELAAVGKDSR